MPQTILTKDFVCTKDIGGKGEMTSCYYKRKATDIHMHPDLIVLNNVSCKSGPSKKDFVCNVLSTKRYKLGDKWSDDFDYCGMLKKGTQVNVGLGMKKLTKLAESFEDVNYHIEAEPLFATIDALKKSNKTKALQRMENFKMLSANRLSETC